MQKVIFNEFSLKEEEMTEIVKRVKLLLINSQNEILIGFSHGEYQFVGGHVENGEEYIDTINREIEEETGIQTNFQELEPFACIQGYYKDYHAKGINRKTEIYYYKINIDDHPDLSKTNYTDDEKKGNFTLLYMPINLLTKKLESYVREHGNQHGIANEMLNIMKIYDVLENNNK